jgi:hypothetical protein
LVFENRIIFLAPVIGHEGDAEQGTEKTVELAIQEIAHARG